MKNHRIHIADRIKAVLTQKGWRQQQLADATGFSKSYISLVLSGAINVTIDTIEIMEKALKEHIITIPK